MQTIISRQDAHAQGLKFYFTGQPCRKDHVAQRYVSTGGCLECLEKYRRPALGGHSGLTKDLMSWQPSRPFWIPTILNAQARLELQKYLRQCVVAWARHQQLVTPELEAAYARHEADAQQKDALELLK